MKNHMVIYGIKDMREYLIYGDIILKNPAYNTICYIGKTNNLNQRFWAHMSKRSNIFAELLEIYNKSDFEKIILNDNVLNNDHALDLEDKYIYNYSNQYNLLNKRINYNELTYTGPKYFNNIKIKCITTNEEFNNIYDASKKYYIRPTRLYKNELVGRSSSL